MVTPKPRVIDFTHGGTTYQLPISGEISISVANDSPVHVPTTGAQDARNRSYHNTLSIKKIRDDFGAQVDLEFENRGGVLDILSDSSMDTRWGPIWMAPKENNPSMPADGGTSIVCGPTNDQDRPSIVTRASHNPMPTVFFSGTTNTGVFAWRVDDIAVSPSRDFDIDIMRWTGTAWTDEHLLVDGSQEETISGYDMVEHKGSLFFFYSVRNPINSAAIVVKSPTGEAMDSISASPVAHARSGSRLFSDGDTLYAFSQVGTTTDGRESISIESTDDEGGSTWDVRTTGLSGTLRDVVFFFDRNETERIVFLTETRLYWYDTANYVENELLQLPFHGRALARFGDRLLIFMDGMRVWEYSPTGAIRDISPGGVQGMPSGKDFGSDAEGQVCIHTSARGVYALWSGADGGGTDLAPLCLSWNGEGWNFIWQKADTSVSNAARFVTIDPVSGDLLMAVQDAISVDSTFVQLKDIEVNPDTQGTLDRQTAGIITTPRLDFGVPVVPTTVWDIFNHTNGLDANETVAEAYRIDGSTGSYTTIATVAADNTVTSLASGVGVNARDFQLQFTYATSAVTDIAKTFDIDVGYTKIWPVRLIYSFDILVGVDFAGGRSADSVRKDITTIMGLSTKGTLDLGGGETDDSATVIPIPETTARELVGDLADPGGKKRSGVWTMYLMEA